MNAAPNLSDLCGLSSQDFTDRNTLAEAGQLLWNSLTEFENWPKPMQSEAERIVLQLLEFGVISESVQRMTESQVHSLAAQLKRLLMLARQFNDQPLAAQQHAASHLLDVTVVLDSDANPQAVLRKISALEGVVAALPLDADASDETVSD